MFFFFFGTEKGEKTHFMFPLNRYCEVEKDLELLCKPVRAPINAGRKKNQPLKCHPSRRKMRSGLFKSSRRTRRQILETQTVKVDRAEISRNEEAACVRPRRHGVAKPFTTSRKISNSRKKNNHGARHKSHPQPKPGNRTITEIHALRVPAMQQFLQTISNAGC